MAGKKYDSEKSRVDLIPYEALEEVGHVLRYGLKKYKKADNYQSGIEIRRLIGASMRHTGKFNSGEDYDPESKTIHLANAISNLCFAIWIYKNKPEFDDRPKRKNNANKIKKAKRKRKNSKVC